MVTGLKQAGLTAVELDVGLPQEEATALLKSVSKASALKNPYETALLRLSQAVEHSKDALQIGIYQTRPFYDDESLQSRREEIAHVILDFQSDLLKCADLLSNAHALENGNAQAANQALTHLNERCEEYKEVWNRLIAKVGRSEFTSALNTLKRATELFERTYAAQHSNASLSL
jgi:hypothetical protein